MNASETVTPTHVATTPPGAEVLGERMRHLATRGYWLASGLALINHAMDSQDSEMQGHASWLADAMSDLAGRVAESMDELATELLKTPICDTEAQL
ncbi:MAG: hypothetical protein Q8M01_15320 [Rubrivivax sp.]|nr:hypothetical protein [Rubrivivax sp.]